MKKLALCLLFGFLCIVAPLSATSHYKVPLSDPIYGRLQFAHNLGLITLNWVQPYSYAQVEEAIDYLIANDKTPKEEKARLSAAKKRLFPSWKQLDSKKLPEGKNMPAMSTDTQTRKAPTLPWWYGQLINTAYVYPWGPLSLEADLNLRADAAMDVVSKRWDVRSRYGLDFYGNIGNNLSYQLDFNFGLDRVENPIITDLATGSIYERGKTPLKHYDTAEYLSYAPFSYTQTWYTVHQFGGDYFRPKAPWKKIDSYFPMTFAYATQIESEIAASALDGVLSFRAGRIRHSWGASSESIFLSSQARPMAAIEFSANLAPWLSYSYLRGVPESGFSHLDALNNPYGFYKPFVDVTGNKKSYQYLVQSQRQRLYSADMIELRPWSWLTLGYVQTTMLPKRYELGYFIPLIPALFYQMNLGDFDNTMLGGFIELRPFSGFRTYLQFNVDEINPSYSLTKNARNTYAYQLGAEAAFPFLWGATSKLQYTKIEPFTFTHYPQPSSSIGGISQKLEDHVVDVSFTNDNEALGSYLPPNSDEILLKLSGLSYKGANFGASYQLIRHGWLAPYNKDTKGKKKIFDGYTGGEYTASLGYAGSAYRNRPKNFLHDGLYRWYNTFGVEASYDFEFPLSLGLKLSYTHSFMTAVPTEGGYVKMGAPYERVKGSERHQFNMYFYAEYAL